ncbi:sulfurtransferase TusA family protein [Caldinitratiruptor microaerophilus]|uniref:UPF0033 domain-containing protein n=1 Tax=Caldinitratiruptor microaerophilus TaxID=671077 RepID=A0AA35G8V9_9FIRM|nr:sulfurtransferase TusA family protein [Caldinitratiruptor microaerophilus]BDG61476.1 hypothetical protein caldi_25660 [Caldinitratiruptor microaerophilus]
MKPEKVDSTLDARGLLCPMPVVRASRAIRDLPAGAILEVLATDRGSVTDIPAWCESQKHELLHWEEDGGVFRYYVRKGG